MVVKEDEVLQFFHDDYMVIFIEKKKSSNIGNDIDNHYGIPIMYCDFDSKW